MTVLWTRYLLAPLCLALAYFVVLDWSGHRLPVYFLGGGEIVPLRETPVRAGRILRIEGHTPSRYPMVFDEPRVVAVLTQTGVQKVASEPFGPLDILYDFRFFFLLSFIYLLLGTWFLAAMRDAHLAGICFALLIALFGGAAALASNELFLVQQVGLFLIPPALINLGLRSTGKPVSGRLIVAELLVITFFGLVAYAGRAEPSVLLELGGVSRLLIFATLAFAIGLQLENALRRGNDPVESSRRWVLLAGSVFGYFLPGLLFEMAPLLAIPPDWSADIFALYLLFPISLLYGTYRIQLVPYQFVLNQSIAAALVTVLFALVFAGALLLHNSLLPDRGSPWIVHLVFLLALVFFLDPARQSLAAFVEKRVFRLDSRLTESLERLALLYTGPLNIQAAVQRFRRELEVTLGVENTQLAFSAAAYPDLIPPESLIHVLPEDSVMWRYLRRDHILVASYLAYGGGTRGELYRWLVANKCVLAIGLGTQLTRRPALSLFRPGEHARGALLIGARSGGRGFQLSEIRYLQEAARLAELVIRNYELLARELRARRSRQEISLAGKLQRTVSESPFREIPLVETSFFNLPAASVSGDYIDLIRLDATRTAFLIGDVSGHGLGTGYLAAVFRTMIRSHLENGMSLAETIALLNKFLLERYRGSEFITLLAVLFDTDTGRMEHINAAHPGPYMLEAATGRITHMRETQRLLGISDSPYHSTTTVLKPNDRLFLYSDGITETFNPLEETFGEERLERFFERHAGDPLPLISEQLRLELRAFRGDDELDDDSSFLAIEYQPGFRPLRSLLQLFRAEARS